MSKLNSLDRAKFRVKINSLAAEARIIRREERKARTPADRSNLHEHRVGIVRQEARSTQLAYALARGVPYAAVERAQKPVDTARVSAIVKSLTGRIESPYAVDAWRRASLAAV